MWAIENAVVHVLGKGRRGRALPFGQQTGWRRAGVCGCGRALDQWEARPELWLDEKSRGPLGLRPTWPDWLPVRVVRSPHRRRWS